MEDIIKLGIVHIIEICIETGYYTDILRDDLLQSEGKIKHWFMCHAHHVKCRILRIYADAFCFRGTGLNDLVRFDAGKITDFQYQTLLQGP